jgi:hypothetical protein
MNKPVQNAIGPCEPGDLPPEVSALIDAAMARAADAAADRRLAVPIRTSGIALTSMMAGYNAPRPRRRSISPPDLALVALLLLLVALGWANLAVGISVTQAAEGTKPACHFRGHASERAVGLKFCERLPQQG